MSRRRQALFDARRFTKLVQHAQSSFSCKTAASARNLRRAHVHQLPEWKQRTCDRDCSDFARDLWPGSIANAPDVHLCRLLNTVGMSSELDCAEPRSLTLQCRTPGPSGLRPALRASAGCSGEPLRLVFVRSLPELAQEMPAALPQLPQAALRLLWTIFRSQGVHEEI